MGIAVVEGPTEASRQTGIPKQTIDYWQDDPLFGQFRTRARDDVMAEWWAGIQLGVRSLIEGIQGDEAPLRDKAQAIDVLARNYQLMSGAATSRTEHADITAHLDDHEVERLNDAIDEWLKVPTE